MFQSPSRRGQHHCRDCGATLTAHDQFQSPSRRGQHHCGPRTPAAGDEPSRFSPLREGDNIIAHVASRDEPWGQRFSPLREGDNIIANGKVFPLTLSRVSVPFAKGTTSLRGHQGPQIGIRRFQSPSRRGQHHCEIVRVALQVEKKFQSPSRRGQHHCCASGITPAFGVFRFSPLREGDNIIARRRRYGRVAGCCRFQSPSRRGQHHCSTRPLDVILGLGVSVPFAKGTTSLQ